MAIRYSSSGGTPFGDTSGRPSSPSVGQTYYNGQLGYLEIYTVSGWIPATGANDFSLNITGTNTTVTFSQTYSSGSYSIVSFLNDASLDIYAYATDGSLAGYTNTKAFTATQRFNKMVILGGSYGDVLQFSYKTTYATSTSTTDVTAGPYITSITPSGMPNQNDTITITGGNFATDVAVVFTGTGYSSTAAKSIVRSSSTQLIVTRPDNFPPSGSPYTVTVTNPSVANQPTGSAVHTYSGITAGVVPVWQTTTIASPNISYGVAYSTTLSATDSDGSSSISYSIVSGSLPTGITLNSSTGVISGTSTSTTSGSYPITVRATDSGGNSANQSFTLIYQTLSGGTLTSDSTYYYRTFTGNGTFSTANSLTCDVLCIGGGGSGGSRDSGLQSQGAGGGGAGGLIWASSYLIPNGAYSITIGAGGNPVTGTTAGNNGIDTTFGSIFTAKGGGGGGGYNGASIVNGKSGGSGGGGGRDNPTTTSGGSSTQTSGTGYTGYGNAGGRGSINGGSTSGAGGGGGAGGSGQDAQGSNRGGVGGIGIGGNTIAALNSIGAATSTGQLSGGNYYYAGGGGAASASPTSATPSAGGLGGGGAGGYEGSFGPSAGTVNTGGGGGADSSNGTSGGSGLVVIRYTKASVGG
ncbi:hypothetical protein EB001_10750 [bacterium]|nr:hypothetical protein [bacterium]